MALLPIRYYMYLPQDALIVGLQRSQNAQGEFYAYSGDHVNAIFQRRF